MPDQANESAYMANSETAPTLGTEKPTAMETIAVVIAL